MDYTDLAHRLPRRSAPENKTFPNNYTNLTMNREYMAPSASPSYADTQTYPSSECSCSSHDTDERLAGMKIFASIMLNSWRRRREDVKFLIEKVEDLKKMSMKSKNQIHVYNTLFRVEQKRNDELQCQLKHSLDTINQAKISCESLTTSVISLKADNALLEQELHCKYREIDTLNDILNQTKDDLFRSMLDQRQLQTHLSREQRNIQFIDSQKSKLIDEICELGAESRKSEHKYNKELERKDEELQLAIKIVHKLERSVELMKTNAMQAKEYCNSNMRVQEEIHQLRLHAKSLQEALDNSIGNRMQGWWQQWLFYQNNTINMAHKFAFYLLPATPPPKFTFKSDKYCL